MAVPGSSEKRHTSHFLIRDGEVMTKAALGEVDDDDTEVIVIDGLGPMTARQKRFAEAYHAHGNGTRAAGEAGYAGDDETLAVAASRLIRNVKVRRYLLRLGKNDQLDRDEIRKLLEREAFTGDHAGARVRAGELLGKALGLFNDDFTLTINRTSDDEIVKALAGDDPVLQAGLLPQPPGRGGGREETKKTLCYFFPFFRLADLGANPPPPTA